MALTVTSPFILSVKAIKPNSTANTATIVNSRLMLNLNFIFFLKHFMNRFNKRIDVSCTYRCQYFEIQFLEFFKQILLVTTNLHGTCNIPKYHVGIHPRDWK